MEIERKVLVRRTYDTFKAEQLEYMLQQYLDDGWEVESITGTHETFCIILWRDKKDTCISGVEE